MVCVCWLVCSTLDEDIPVTDEVNSDVLCPSVVGNGGARDEGVPVVDNVGSSIEPPSMVDVWNEVMLMDSVSVVEVNWVVCVCWLVCSTLDDDIYFVDEANSDILCPSVIVERENGVVPVVDSVGSSVITLSFVGDSNGVMLMDSVSVVEVN